MSLLDAIKLAPKPLDVDYGYLHSEANSILKPKLEKRKSDLEGKVVMTVSDKANLASCSRLSAVVRLPAGILFHPPGKKTNLPLKNKDVIAFRSALLLFDADDPAKKIMDEYTTNPPDGQFGFLSDEFVKKHYATGADDAETKASDRYTANNVIAVSSFLYPDDIIKFSKEVEDCNPIFLQLLERIKNKESRYRQRNKRIDDLVIRSASKYNKVQCTQNNTFKPAYYDPEYVYYGISTPASSPKIICDHYVQKSNVFDRDKLKPGWKILDYKKKLPSSSTPLPDIELYVQYGTFD